MAYDYIRRVYGVDPVPGQRVEHTVTGKSGVITRDSGAAAHYVKVRFDGQTFTSPCHPTELKYLGVAA
jgi:hypothetical protein